MLTDGLQRGRPVALARLGMATVMAIATQVGLRPKWPQFSWVPYAYGVVAVVAVALLASPTRSSPSTAPTSRCWC
ncbi:hypothetical protein ACXDF8_10795 [Mycolicibacterium sp. CBM1]